MLLLKNVTKIKTAKNRILQITFVEFWSISQPHLYKILQGIQITKYRNAYQIDINILTNAKDIVLIIEESKIRPKLAEPVCPGMLQLLENNSSKQTHMVI